MNLKKIFAGMFGSNDPKYRTAKLHEMILSGGTSGAKMVFYILNMYASYAMNEGFGIAVAVTGIIIQAKTIFDGITDPVVALIYDRLPVFKRFGKIRLFLVLGWALCSGSSILMFNVLPHYVDNHGLKGGAVGIVLFIVVYALFVIGYTIMSIGGASTISSALTNDPKQRPFVTFITTTYQRVGPMLMNTILAFTILPKHNNEYNVESLSEACFVFVIVAFGFVLLSCIGLRRIDTPEILGEMVALGGKQTKVGIKEIISIFKENVPMRCYLITGITDKIASNAATQTIILTLLNGILIANYKTATMITNIGTIVGFVFTFVGGMYIAKKGVKVATKTMSLVNIVINLGIFIFLAILGPENMANIGKASVAMVLYTTFMLGVSAASMILNVAEGMMRADVIDYELSRSGKYMPGTVGAVYSLTEKIIASFGATIAAVAVAAIGYKNTMPQMGDEATWPIFWVVAILTYGLPIVGWIANIIAMHFYELDYERMGEIQQEIADVKNAARAGKK
ncbi:MAG: MFS transporter [Lachnospiraceae bacterium]|nr:MFS transporter [Lachnospiraceae bacterium]